MMIIGVDTGGTFTDFIYKHQHGWGVYKLPSTPHAPSRAVTRGLCSLIPEQEPLQVVHGSTVATNAILEHKGVPTAVVTNRGFEDLLVIGRQERSRIYDLFFRRQESIVPRGLRFGLGGRLSAEGEELEPLNEEEAARVARDVQQSGARSAAVCLLFSYLDPGHEQKIARHLREMGIHVSASQEILAEFREFERLSTCVVNAYVSPTMSDYLQELDSFLGQNPLRVMQSNGGSISVHTARQESVRTILSGPAGGAVGAMETARAAGLEKIISFDMGGTSTDVCLMDGELPISLETRISGYPLKVPMIDIHTVGAGGGSLAGLDSGGSLQVGPESAGADPGPACYGKGERITVTDADLFLGRLVPERFLGGGMQLYPERSRRVLEETAGKAGLTPAQLGEGVLEVAHANMERALRVISVERGHDPREFTLVSFGGAAGMHCADLARLLGIPRVLVPKNPGILSAVGMVMADVIRDYSRTVMLAEQEADPDKLKELLAPLEERGLADMRAEGFDPESVFWERYLDMRYRGQSFEIVVPYQEDFTEVFARMHEGKYGYRHPERQTEVVNIRLRLRAKPQKPALRPAGELIRRVPEEAFIGRQQAVFNGSTLETAILERERLLPGNRFQGPAVIAEYTSTIVLPPFARAEVDAFENILMHLEG